MVSHKRILAIRIEEKKNKRRQKSDIRECAQYVLAQDTQFLPGQGLSLHGMAATRAEGCGIGHLGGTIRAPFQPDWGLFYQGHDITPAHTRIAGINLGH